jgi:hypothetical protein
VLVELEEQLSLVLQLWFVPLLAMLVVLGVAVPL